MAFIVYYESKEMRHR